MFIEVGTKRFKGQEVVILVFESFIEPNNVSLIVFVCLIEVVQYFYLSFAYFIDFSVVL
jgi:hypothetical protein